MQSLQWQCPGVDVPRLQGGSWGGSVTSSVTLVRSAGLRLEAIVFFLLSHPHLFIFTS